MKIVDLSRQASALNHFLSQLRDVNMQNDRLRFRQNLKRIGRVMAYELSKTLSYQEQAITTPLGVKQAALSGDRIVVGTVLRAGLSLHEGFLSVFDDADSAFVAAYREEGEGDSLKVRLEYRAAPCLDGSTFIMVDPMLATGGSLVAAHRAFLEAGTPKHLHICVVIAAPEGIAALQKAFPSDDVTLWTAAIDERLNEKAYIVPGLGDAGDLCFGEKI